MSAHDTPEAKPVPPSEPAGKSRVRPNATLWMLAILLAASIAFFCVDRSGYQANSGRAARAASTSSATRGALASPAPPLFKDPDPATAPPLPPLPKTATPNRHPPRRRVVQLDTELTGPHMEKLLQSKPGDRFLLPLFPEVTETIQFDRFDTMADTIRLWHGRIPKKPGSWARFIVVDGVMTADFGNLEATYTLRPITESYYALMELKDVGLMEYDSDHPQVFHPVAQSPGSTPPPPTAGQATPTPAPASVPSHRE